jgi:hypothetical protein
VTLHEVAADLGGVTRTHCDRNSNSFFSGPEVEHAAARIQRLEQAIDTSVETVPAKMRAVIQGGLQALRGIAKVSAVSILSELGEVSRFAHPRQLMGYSGAVSSRALQR